MCETEPLSPAQIDFLVRSLPGFDPGDGMAVLAGRAASQRHFLRIRHAGSSYILVVWDSRDEDWDRFLAIGRERHATGALLPEIVADDPGHGLILEEDLGECTLKRLCGGPDTDPGQVATHYRAVLEALVRWQSPGVAAIPAIAARTMDRETFLWESAYFARHAVTDYCGCEALLDAAWDKERSRLAAACGALPCTALHRDFQSENVLVHEGRIRFVDFQGARLGPPQYDVASLLYDPYSRAVAGALREELLHHYCRIGNHDEVAFRSTLLPCAAQRLMQALGAYANLALHRGKEWYRNYIPLALQRLCAVTGALPDYPVLNRVARRCKVVADR